MSQETALPVLAVVYAFGSVSPMNIVRAAEGEARLLFLIDSRDEHSAEVLPVLGALAPILDLAVPGTQDPEGLWDACTAAAGSPVAGIITFSESKMRATAALAQALDVLYHDPGTAEALTDKARQRALLNAGGVSVTRQVAVDDTSGLPGAAEEVGYPLVVKPVRGDSGRYTVRCADKDELEEACATVLPARLRDDGPSWQAEELLVGSPHPGGDWLGDYVSVESVTDAAGTWHFAVSDKLPLAPPFREHGTVMPGALPAELRSDVTEMTTSALSALGVGIGITHTELKLTAHGPRVIEVNGRLGGGVARLMNRCSDLDPIRLAVRTALGHPASRRPVVFDRTALLYLALPPMRRVRVQSVADRSWFLRHPRVWDVDMDVRPGDVLDWRNGLRDRVFTIRAEGVGRADIAEVVRWLDEVCEDRVTYEPAD